MASRYDGPYRAGTAPGGSVNMPGAGGDAFGAPVGGAVAEFGRAIDRRDIVKTELAERLARENEAAAFGVSYAEAQERIERFINERRAGAEAGAPRHTGEVEAYVDEQIAELMRPLTNRRVRNAAAEQTAELRGRIIPREEGWEIGQRVQHRSGQVDQAIATTSARIAAMPLDNDAPTALVGALTDLRRQVGLFELPGNESERLVREGGRAYVVAFANNLVDNAPDQLEALIGNADFNQFLNGDDVTRLRGGARVELRRREVAAEAQRSREEAEGRENIGGYVAMLEDDRQLDDEQMADYQRLVEAYGTPAQRVQFEDLSARAGVSRQYREATVAQMDARINALEAKGEQRTDAEDLELRHLVPIRDRRRTANEQDPGGLLDQQGGATVNWDAPDPAAVRQRVAQARAAQRLNRSSVPGIFDRERLRVLQERFAQGPAGQLEIARWLRQTLGGDADLGAMQVARPGTREGETLAALVRMHPNQATYYQRGLAALERNGALWKAGDAAPIMASLRDAFHDQASFDAIMAVARPLSAALAEGDGMTEFNERALRTAINEAVGQQRHADGRVTGGITGFYGGHVILPPNMTSDEFERAIMGAEGPAFGRAAVDADGNPRPGGARHRAANGQVLDVYNHDIQDGLTSGRLRLRTRRPGVYSIVDRNNRPMQHQSGGIYYFAPGRLNAAAGGLDVLLDAGRALAGGRRN